MEHEQKENTPKRVLTFEDLIPFFLDNSTLKIEAPERLYRINYPGGRVYYRLNDQGDPIMYWGGTTFSDHVCPEDETHLRRWMLEMFNSIQEYKEWMNNKADYGSFSHWQYGRLLRDQKINYLELESDLLSFLQENRISVQVYYHNWLERSKKDLLSFRQWIQDYNVRPVSIEHPIYSDAMGIATQIDLICLIDIPLKSNGEPYARKPSDFSKVKNWEKDVLAIIDTKSKAGAGDRSTFYSKECLQLVTNRFMWNSLYGEFFPVIKIFNWSPKDWVSLPSYNFKDWTGSNEEKWHLARWEGYEILWSTAKVNLPVRTWVRMDEITIKGQDDYTLLDLEKAIRNRHELNKSKKK